MRRTYHEVLFVMGTEQDERRFWYDLVAFHQPVLRRWLAQVFKAVEHVSSPLVRRSENYLEARHKKRCNGDCGTWIHGEDGSEHPGCTYWPLSARQSMYYQELSRRGREVVERREISRDEALRYGWPAHLDY